MTMAEADITKLTMEGCELGEGPHYNCATNTAWWLDIVGRKLMEFQLANETVIGHSLPRMASQISTIDGDRQLLCMEDGFYIRQIVTGSLTFLAELEADNPVTRSNDGRVHPSGNLWIGTMGKQAEKQAGAIYWFNGKEVRCLFPDISIPNSICFSPDGKIAYFADTAVNTIWRVATDPSTGMPTGTPEGFLTGDDLPLGGRFDGSVTDANGVLWNASWGGGAVSGFAPDGSLVQTFEIPTAQTTCPCFVGKDLQQMLVTSARQGLSQQQLALDPGAGYTYIIKGQFQGTADVNFRLQS